MALNLPTIVPDFLREKQPEKFTAREVAEWVRTTYPDECRQKLEDSEAINNEKELLRQIVAEIGAQRKVMQRRHQELKITDGRPRKYYFSDLTDSDDDEQAERAPISPASKIKEHDLYPKLGEFLSDELNIYTKRINESESSNNKGARGNEWLHPDLVGLEDLSADWNQVVKESVQRYYDKITKLWSFEVKTRINRSNVRRAFFQAVSNSSWANFGYLVASEIEGEDTSKELRMLSSLHGIGFIQLEVDNPLESQIMIPARERGEIDWNTANRLAKENKKFLTYIEIIGQFYLTKKLKKSEWDWHP